MDYSGLVDKAKASTWGIYVSDEKGNPVEGYYSGTAFAVSSDGKFLTANHVIDSMLEFEDHENRYVSVARDITSLHGDKVTLTGLKIIKTYPTDKEDVAVLQFPEKAVKLLDSYEWLPVRSSGEGASIGEPVVAFGYPINTFVDGSWRIKQRSVPGNITSYDTWEDEPPKYEVNALFHPGLSGGPLISINEGDVIGVVSSRGKYSEDVGGEVHNIPSHFSQATILTTNSISKIGEHLEENGIGKLT